MPAAAPHAFGLCYLRDQQPISPEAFAAARRLCEKIRALIAGRNDYIQSKGRPAEIGLPNGHWEPERRAQQINGVRLYDAYKTVVDGDYSIINNLRLFSQIFTGFRLISLSRFTDATAAGKAPADYSIPRELPPDVDEKLSALDGRPSPDVAVYLDAIAQLPESLHITPPNAFGEVGWLVNDKIVNHDTNAYLERLVLLAETGKLWELRNRTPEFAALRKRPWQRPCILEIGGGYGGLAHYIVQLIPNARYYIVDIPESLLFSSIYLSTLWPDHDNVLITPDNLHDLAKDTAGFTFVPNYLFDECCAAARTIDLAINTLSMSEMTERQVRDYCTGIRGLMGRDGVFFEQNQDNRHFGHLDAKSVVAEHFPWFLRVNSLALPITQGQANLWSDAPEIPRGWCASSGLQQNSPAEEPHLMEQDYHGFNIIYFSGSWYGLPPQEGAFDADKVRRRQYKNCLTATSRAELLDLIARPARWLPLSGRLKNYGKRLLRLSR